MAKADVRVFGGLVPRSSPRALSSEGAQVAHNLSQQTAEFLPLPEDTEVIAESGVSDPKTIFRFKRKADGSLATDFSDLAQWEVSAVRLSWAAGQVNNDLTDRHYVSFDDGSAAPRSIDATGESRLLGVPAPTDAPDVAVNVVDEFTPDDRNAAITAVKTAVASLAAAAMVPVWRGSSSTDPTTYRPGTTHNGYLDINGVGLDNLQFRAFRLASTGGANDGAISDTYDSANGPSAYQWVLDPSLWGEYRSADGDWPSWAGSAGQDHWTIPFFAYGLTYDIDGSGLSTALQAIDKPNGAPGEKLLDAGQAAAAVAAVAVVSNNQWTEVAPKLNNLKAQVDILHSMMGGGGYAQPVSSLADFYAQTDVSGEIDDAIANCAEALWNLAVQAAAAVHIDYPGG